MAYSQGFSTMEKFGDAIQLKVFISAQCPNIGLLERVLKILLKMIKSHPDEVVKQTNEIWLMMIQMIFGLS